MTPRLFILGLDGVPFTLLRDAFAAGKLPQLKRLSEGGTFAQLRSVVPTISSVAWASFMTGHNPGKHGIYGFIERNGKLERFIPTGGDVRTPAIWERLNKRGLKTISMNVPLTYPPKAVDGVLIGGFLCPNIDRVAYPKRITALLKEKNYIIDPNPRLAATDKDAFLEEIFRAFRARTDVALHLMREEPWDFFICHIMETDRLHHFFWDDLDDETAKYHHDFWKFYEQVDAFVGQLLEELPQNSELLLLSDHGFCGIRSEPDLNVFLKQQGFLSFKPDARDLPDLDPRSTAYTLPPGRVFLNLKGREPQGSVAPADAEKVKEELSEALLGLKDPKSGDPVIQRVYRRDELYHGPHAQRSADLVAHPHRGFDLKGGITSGELFSIGARNGMHTYRDAFLLIKDRHVVLPPDISIIDMARTSFALLGLPVPEDLDGRDLLDAGA